MGMFDSMLDAAGAEWQTKALDCLLHRWSVGDELPAVGQPLYQVEIYGGPGPGVDSYATVRDDVLVSIHDERDPQMPLLRYHGDWDTPDAT